MATRNSTKRFAENKSYLDDAIKNLVTKSDIGSLKSFIEDQSGVLKRILLQKCQHQMRNEILVTHPLIN